MAKYAPDPRAYELMILLTPELGDESLESEIERISGLAQQSGVEVVSVKATNPWGRRRLAYQIQKHNDAYYVLYSLSSVPGGLDEFERELKLNSRVLRYLLVKQDEEAEEEEAEEADGETEAASDADGGDSDEADVSAAEADGDNDAAADEPEAVATVASEDDDETA